MQKLRCAREEFDQTNDDGEEKDDKDPNNLITFLDYPLTECLAASLEMTEEFEKLVNNLDVTPPWG